MVLGEVSISPAYCALEQKKPNTTEDCTLFPLFFMTQTHLEVCTESFNTERIILSLAAIGWATVSPAAISSGCFSISLPNSTRPGLFSWCHTVYIRPAYTVMVILQGFAEGVSQQPPVAFSLVWHWHKLPFLERWQHWSLGEELKMTYVYSVLTRTSCNCAYNCQKDRDSILLT